MLPAASSPGRAWVVARWGTVGLLVAAALLFVPPGSLPYAPGSAYSDAAISHWPNAFFLRDSVWTNGQWPLWNPLRMLGQPFAANPLSKVWYPPQWLVLILPPTAHLNTMIYAHLAWLALGMIAWLRAERLRPLATAFAALAWGLNPKLVAHLGAGHLDMLYALAWTPWLLWAVRRVRDAPSPERGVMLGITAALLALGDLRIAFLMFAVAGVMALAFPPVSLSARQKRKMSWWPWFLAAIVLILLTGVQTIPLLALSSHLTRARITPQEAAVYSLPARHLIGLLVADAGGFHEWMTYLGLPVIGLALAAPIRHERHLIAWWIIAALAVLWALGSNGPLFLALVERVPLASWFRVPPRAWFVVALSLIALAARGLDRLMDSGLGRTGKLVVTAASAAGLVWAIASAVLRLPGNVTGAGVALAGTGIGLWLLGQHASQAQTFSASVGSGILILTLTASLLIVDATLIEGRTLEEINAGDAEILAHLPDRCILVYSPSFDLIGPAAAQAGIATLHGVDPFQFQWSSEAISEAAGVEPAGYSITVPPLPADADDPARALADAEPDTQQLAWLGVEYLVTRFPLQSPATILEYSGDGAYVYRLPQAEEFVCSDGPNRFAFQPTAGASRLTIPQAWAPGWRALSGGGFGRIWTQGGVRLGVDLSSPDLETVIFVYRPSADFAGMATSGATVLGLFIWWIVAHTGSARRGP